MSLLERLAHRFGFISRERVEQTLALNARLSGASRRTYEAGQVSRLTADFVPAQVSADTDLVARLRLMRVRSRYLFKNEPYARRFVRTVQKNVVGSGGVQLSVLGSDEADSPLRLKVAEALAIEERWKAWACSSFVTTDGRTSWRQAQRLAASNAVTDGETFARLVVSPANPYLVSLRFFVPDQFDETFNTVGPTSQIRLSVETLNATGERIAYWPTPNDPGDMYAARFRQAYTRIRVPAGEVVHWFVPDFVNQTRGVPWLFSAIPQLNMLNGYADAELVASRVSAAKMGFFKPPEGQTYSGDGKDARGNTITEVSPGSFETLPAGTDLLTFDPQHPNANFAGFQKAMLRGVAAAGDVAYHTLSGDLEGVNYSSARVGLLDERSGFEMLQDEFIHGFCRPVFRAWLVAQAALGVIPLTPQEAQTFDQVIWRPRRWSWVDPQKEIAAAAMAVALRIKSRTQICAEMGDTFARTAAELGVEEEQLDELGLLPANPAVPNQQPPGAGTPQADGAKDEEEPPEGAAGGRQNGSRHRTVFPEG